MAGDAGSGAPSRRRSLRSLVSRLRSGAGTVRVRTTVAATVLVGLALLAGGVALVVAMRDALTDEVRNVARVRAADTAAALEAGTDPSFVTAGLDRDDDDAFIQILDGDGNVVAASPLVAGEPAVAHLEPGQSTEVEVTDENDEFLAVAADAGGRYTVIAGRILDTVNESTSVVTDLLIIGLPVLLAVAAVTTWLVVGRALAPVESIRREVDAISSADLDRRVPNPPGNDEIARLAMTMNSMLERLEQGQARQRRFVADASHELRSPVASIRQHAEVAQAHPERTTLGALAETVAAENLRVERLVDDLLLLTRADEHTLQLQQRPVDLDDLVFEEALRLRESTTLRVDTTRVSAGRVSGDRSALWRALRNLGDNAVRHAASRVAFSLDEQDGAVVLEVDDDGPGIATADRQRVFERFVRLDDARARDVGGSGLGLAIVAEVVGAHHGTISIGHSGLGGARFQVRLPAVDTLDDEPE
ncbi:MAG TPA: ATP-binding protein [Acidimicrobiales bacterium]|nr:ATP-binding protein [Acidimicrobiales bacterium]